ncbi:CoA transferase [Nocardia vinacea]|uniref:CoA transferase n=1 Tax=Nocardia vinacea TaxID=96468 RepID=A0ABZ1YW84_9NOCA|nr:CoA transferase [Nocardia vinacea]
MLRDIVVVEAGRRESAAWCGRLLADLGADVVRVGAAADTIGGNREYADYLHAGKRRAAAVEATEAHIVVTDGPCEQTDLLIEALRQKNPAVVVVSVTDYGSTGPAAEKPASELTLQAEAGLVILHPTGDRPPVGMGIDLSEQMSGRCAAAGALIGLLAVDAGGLGTEVDVSRFESVVSVLQYPWLYEQIPDHFVYPVPQMAVPGIERAKDGWVCVIAVSPQQWTAFKKLAANPALEDPRFEVLPERVRLAGKVRPYIREFTEQHTVSELVELGFAHRVPIVPVTDPCAVAELAPYAEREAVVHSTDGRYCHPGPSFRLAPAAVPAPPSVSAAASGTPERPLRGLRVLEIGTFQAGPLVGSHLASLGADVVRVESVRNPDMIRFTGAPPTTNRFWELAAGFAAVNVGKRTITADMSDPQGRAIVEKLIAASDVLVENYVPRVLDKHGFDYAGVRALRKNIVMVRMPAWGSSGQWRDQPGFTYTANATSGLSWLTGYPDGEPTLTGTLIDPIAGMVATIATLAAVRRQRRTGAGALVEVPLCDVALQLSASSIIAASTGRTVMRSGNRRPDVAPQGIYHSRDRRWIALTVSSDAAWKALCELAGDRNWAQDEGLTDTATRVGRQDELDAELAVFCAEFDSDHLVSELSRRGIAAAVVEIGADLVDHPQLNARQRVFTLDHPVAGRARYLGLPMRFSHDPAASADRPAPLFGQHSREILAEIGFGAGEIDAFEEAGLLGRSPFDIPFAV